MRSLLAAVLILLAAACANVRPQQSAGVVVVPESCFDSASHDAIHISVINGAKESVSFPAYGSVGPPYNLYPRAFDLVADDATPTNPNHWAVILEEFTPPDHEVHVGPGDRTEFRAYASQWPTSSYTGRVKLRVRDSHGFIYSSGPVPVCAPGSAPNNSFKPKPLRGSA